MSAQHLTSVRIQQHICPKCVQTTMCSLLSPRSRVQANCWHTQQLYESFGQDDEPYHVVAVATTTTAVVE